MKVLAYPRQIFISSKVYLQYRDVYLRYTHVRELIEHDRAEDCSALVQQMIFLMIPYANLVDKFYIFILPDGTKSCGIPLHATLPSKVHTKGTAELHYDGALSIWVNKIVSYPSEWVNKIVAYPSDEYINARSLSGDRVPRRVFTVTPIQHFPRCDFFWGKDLNHAVFVVVKNIRNNARAAPDYQNPKNYLSLLEFLHLSDRDELSTAVAELKCRWR